MATSGVKRLRINGDIIQVKTATATFKPSGSAKTPIVDENGKIMGFTKENSAGYIKCQVSALKKADTYKLKDLEDGEVNMEMEDGTNVVGTNITQTADNEITVADGVIEYEFHGDVVVR